MMRRLPNFRARVNVKRLNFARRPHQVVIFACVFTLIALHRPHGSQPATYGHLQTLANLVGEWSPVMWWGHKVDRILYCHTGGVFMWSRG
ncbi:hypothetical protein BDR05DRAFT_970906 [Suillus weaverae]|nr:hypothetical protein BDR05DRAFT_970906 [Suillus weaverae]